jgi:molecular chaperone GrpE
VLNKAGLVRIEALGAPFDPNHHEAMSLETGEGNEQVVVEELRSGYLWMSTVLRPAMVRVREQ